VSARLYHSCCHLLRARCARITDTWISSARNTSHSTMIIVD